MYPIIRHFFCALVVLAVALPVAAQGDYGFLWWAHGWRGTSPEGARVVCVQTNHYGLALDVGKPAAFMKRLASGRIVLVWNRVYPEGKTSYRRRVGKWSETPVSWCREEVSMVISDTNGENWSDPVVIAKKPGIWMAYPYLFEPEPGTIWVFASGGLKAEFKEADFVTE